MALLTLSHFVKHKNRVMLDKCANYRNKRMDLETRRLNASPMR